MSRRLATVLRVAALQETLARAEAGRAGAAVHAALAVQEQRTAALGSARLGRGTPAELQQSLALRALRAQGVQGAVADVARAEADRTASLGAWTRARARARLLEELDGRLRAEAEAVEQKAAQRLADDLTAARRGAGDR